MSTYDEFLERVINDGVAAAKHDYIEEWQRAHLFGSLAGFEACRKKTVVELYQILKEARQISSDSFRQREEPDTYWFKRCYILEVEWVCNVVSAMLIAQGLTPFIEVTARGMMKAAEILGVKS